MFNFYWENQCSSNRNSNCADVQVLLFFFFSQSKNGYSERKIMREQIGLNHSQENFSKEIERLSTLQISWAVGKQQEIGRSGGRACGSIPQTELLASSGLKSLPRWAVWGGKGKPSQLPVMVEWAQGSRQGELPGSRNKVQGVMLPACFPVPPLLLSSMLGAAIEKPMYQGDRHASLVLGWAIFPLPPPTAQLSNNLKAKSTESLAWGKALHIWLPAHLASPCHPCCSNHLEQSEVRQAAVPLQQVSQSLAMVAYSSPQLLYSSRSAQGSIGWGRLLFPYCKAPRPLPQELRAPLPLLPPSRSAWQNARRGANLLWGRTGRVPTTGE